MSADPAADEEARALVNLLWALARDTLHPMDGTFLHAEATDGLIVASLFRDEGGRIAQCPIDRAVFDALRQLHAARAPDDRWAAMLYAIDDNQVRTAFLRADEIDPALSPEERRAAILERRFGDRAILYRAGPTISMML